MKFGLIWKISIFDDKNDPALVFSFDKAALEMGDLFAKPIGPQPLEREKQNRSRNKEEGKTRD